MATPEEKKEPKKPTKSLKEINLNFNLVDLDGNEITSHANAGKLLAGVLMSEKKGDAVKFFDWALTLHKCEPIFVDNADFTTLLDVIKNSENVMMITRAQLIKFFDSIK